MTPTNDRNVSEGKKIVTLTDRTRKLLLAAFSQSSESYSGYKPLQYIVGRLVGSMKDGELQPASGFDDPKQAASDISYVMGSLAACAGHEKDSEGNKYFHKYRAYNNALREPLKTLLNRRVLKESEIISAIQELEFQCPMAGISLNGERSRR